MKKTRVNINSIYNSIYDIIKLRRKYNTASNEKPHKQKYRGLPLVTSLIRSSKTARKAKTRKTKINFPLLPEKRHWKQRSVCETTELEEAKIGL
jgi:hypothetical protein